MSKKRHNKTKAELINEVRIEKAATRLNEAMLSEGFEVHPEGYLDGKKVKVNIDRYEKGAKNKELSQQFIDMLNNTVGKEYVAKYDGSKKLYSLSNLKVWLFSDSDLIEVVDRTAKKNGLRGRIRGSITRLVQSIKGIFTRA